MRYHGNRLIHPFLKVGIQQQSNEQGRGVRGWRALELLEPSEEEGEGEGGEGRCDVRVRYVDRCAANAVAVSLVLETGGACSNGRPPSCTSNGAPASSFVGHESQTGFVRRGFGIRS